MRSSLRTKILAVGTALITGGLLTGIAAIYFDALPRLSLPASIAGTITFCLAIVGVLVGFAWFCEKFDNLRVVPTDELSVDLKKAKLRKAHQPPEAASLYRARHVSPSGSSPSFSAGDRPPATDASFSSDGSVPSGTITVTAQGWRGQ
jgi:hypothetical protein